MTGLYLHTAVGEDSELGKRRRNDLNQNAKRKKEEENRTGHPRTIEQYRMFQHTHNWSSKEGVGNKATPVFEEVMAKNFPKLMKNNKTHTQEAQ